MSRAVGALVNDVPVRRFLIWLCDLCIAGRGGVCHVPGCALCFKSAPDVPLAPEPHTLVEVADRRALRDALAAAEG